MAEVIQKQDGTDETVVTTNNLALRPADAAVPIAAQLSPLAILWSNTLLTADDAKNPFDTVNGGDAAVDYAIAMQMPEGATYIEVWHEISGQVAPAQLPKGRFFGELPMREDSSTAQPRDTSAYFYNPGNGHNAVDWVPLDVDGEYLIEIGSLVAADAVAMNCGNSSLRSPSRIVPVKGCRRVIFLLETESDIFGMVIATANK